MSVESSASTSEFAQGLGILLIAQFFSAYMGAFTEDTYAEFDASWTENLFYSHFLSLPFFVPLSGTLRSQYRKLTTTPHINVQQYVLGHLLSERYASADSGKLLLSLCAFLEQMPSGVLYLLINALTQLVCISGVNLLSAKSSAVTVTIVLNIRKLVSFIFSTLLFGHHLNAKMILGSTLVFGSGGLYGWETSWRIPRAKEAAAVRSNGSTEKKGK